MNSIAGEIVQRVVAIDRIIFEEDYLPVLHIRAGNDEEIVKFQIQGAKDVVLESARAAG